MTPMNPRTDWISRRFVSFVILTLSVLPLMAQTHPQDAWEIRQNRRQPAEIVLKEIGIEPGMKVGEIGAGRGRYAVQLAQAVGSEGKVYANDIDRASLDYLRTRLKRDRILNIEVALGTETDPKLPVGTLDRLFMVNTYHHVGDIVALMQNARASLKADGRFALVEAAPQRSDIDKSHATPRETVIAQMERAGFELERLSEALPGDTIYLFKIKTDNPK